MLVLRRHQFIELWECGHAQWITFSRITREALVPSLFLKSPQALMFSTNSCFYEKRNSSVTFQGEIKENLEMHVFLFFLRFLIQGLGRWDVCVCVLSGIQEKAIWWVSEKYRQQELTGYDGMQIKRDHRKVVISDGKRCQISQNKG